MPDAAHLPRHVIRLSDLSERRDTEVTLDPTPEERSAVAAELGILAVRKLRFAVRLTPESRHGWKLDAMLGATVVQECVATLAPVTTRIDEGITRRYLADWSEPEGTEVEMPDDDTIEALPTTLDLAQVMIEALALALPDYPRAPDAKPADISVAAPGAEPIRDEEVKPFAGLAGLRDKLNNAGGSGTEGEK